MELAGFVNKLCLWNAGEKHGYGTCKGNVCESVLRRARNRAHIGRRVAVLHGFETAESSAWCMLDASDQTRGERAPLLIVAPMEVLGCAQFRAALLAVGGMDEFVTEFIRVPEHELQGSRGHMRHVRGIVKHFDVHETLPVKITPQIMGGEIMSMCAAVESLVMDRGAPGVDLNCGCPAKGITGSGGGSSLLRDPNALHGMVRALRETADACADRLGHFETSRAHAPARQLVHSSRAEIVEPQRIQTTNVAVKHKVQAPTKERPPIRVPISVKMRTGYASTELFDENVLAIAEGGASRITIHGRTKVQHYTGSADWSMVARAKHLLTVKYPQYTNVQVIGNGDINTTLDAAQILSLAKCDGLMLGRGACKNPLIFRQIKQQVLGHAIPERDRRELVRAFWTTYASAGVVPKRANTSMAKHHKTQVAKYKMMVNWFFQQSHNARFREILLTTNTDDPLWFMDQIIRFALLA
ncbi:tRNA-dihydrouridine(16) synthase [Porphyridium purpureum]|uniref:tRNA-dihydrouridine(47) synthase [NAD(P)(+)] n=1 Tax=Porphyridium purpureum TaxID=35688 RepID=A0A5J4YZS9_PORPP|nr:tRNA-dihydrouridine(16) synthase [Porphyridium purpureum]|eukprot:POR4865..scf209_3